MGVFSNLVVDAFPAAAATNATLPLSGFGLVAGDLLAVLGVICALIPAGLVARSLLRRRLGSPVMVYRFPSEAPGSPLSSPRRG